MRIGRPVSRAMNCRKAFRRVCRTPHSPTSDHIRPTNRAVRARHQRACMPCLSSTALEKSTTECPYSVEGQTRALPDRLARAPVPTGKLVQLGLRHLLPAPTANMPFSSSNTASPSRSPSSFFLARRASTMRQVRRFLHRSTCSRRRCLAMETSSQMRRHDPDKAEPSSPRVSQYREIYLHLTFGRVLTRRRLRIAETPFARRSRFVARLKPRPGRGRRVLL